MKTKQLLLLVPLTFTQIAFAARTNAPPRDDQARACLAALSIQYRESKSVTVLAVPTRFGIPEEAELLIVDEFSGGRRTLRLAKIRFAAVRALLPRSELHIRDTQIETRNLSVSEYQEFRNSREEIGYANVRISPHATSPTRYIGADHLIPGDVVEIEGKFLLVIFGHPTRQLEVGEGYIEGSRYVALELPGPPEAGLTVAMTKPTGFSIEEYTYSGSHWTPPLVGHAEFSGGLSNVGGVTYGAKLISFTPREPELSELVQMTVSDYRGIYEKRQPR